MRVWSYDHIRRGMARLEVEGSKNNEEDDVQIWKEEDDYDVSRDLKPALRIRIRKKALIPC